MTGRPTPNQRCAVEVVLDSSLDLQRLPRARINNSHTTFAYHIPIPLQKESIILIYRYDTGKCRTLGGKKRALWEREPDPPRRIAWVGCGAEKLEGDTPRRAGAQPNSCVPLEGNPRRCTELFVLGLRLTLASHGDLDVGDRCACYTPTPQRGDGSSGTGSRRDVDLGDILRSRTGRWMEDR